MRASTWILLFLLAGLPACQKQPQVREFVVPATAISAVEASAHIGETLTVCGWVASARYVYWSRGQPTFLNLDQAYPNQVFTVVIWSLDRPKFGMPPEKRFLDKPICVTGLIENVEGLPQMVVSQPAQIEFLKQNIPQ
ncbi:DNA-binding protein [Candidatus Neomarinimicrobiota bacterium]